MSLLYVNAAEMKSETFTIGKEQVIPIRSSGLVLVLVTSGSIIPISSPVGACTVSGWTCSPEPSCLVGLEEDTKVTLYYSSTEKRQNEELPTKKLRVDESETDRLMTKYGDRLVNALKIYHGLVIQLSYRNVSVEGKVTGFAVEPYRRTGKLYPRIVVYISMQGQSAETTHVGFTHRLLEQLPTGRQLSFWAQARIKRGDRWISVDKILPLGVRCFTDEALILSHLKQT